MKKNLGRFFSENIRNRFGKAVLVLAALMLICWVGQEKVRPDYTAQDSWHLIRAEIVDEGIAVETAGENLMLHKGVRVKADSEEGDAFLADFVRDGISDDMEFRWSSANDWESCDHWLKITFPDVVQVGMVRLYWERTNALDYALEYSEDGKNWIPAVSFQTSPQEECQDIYLPEAVQTRYLRLHVTDVTRMEEDLSLYYQNISLLEVEVYEKISDQFLIQTPMPSSGTDRTLEIPDVPDNYSLNFMGADYEMLVDESGKIADTIADTRVELGFALEKDGVQKELPGISVALPASEPVTQGASVLPEGFEVMEWRGGESTFVMPENVCIVVEAQAAEELKETAELFAKELSALMGQPVNVTAEETQGPVISLSLREEGQEKTDATEPLGSEGYVAELMASGGEAVRISANTVQGLRYGCVDFCRLFERTKGQLPEGVMRDYPRYSVRGFGIDVGRRAISLELLYQIVEEMSQQKMNMLLVHLNDNQIISESDYDGTVEGAYQLYAGFRLESELKNEAGEGITSEDLYYTKEEFRQFIKDAAVYGVNVVPEIDTPAHSLFIIKRFPKLGLTGDPEGADQLNLSNPDAVELVLNLWREYLLQPETGGQKAVFADCTGVHIGMDEYFGDKKAYTSYLKQVSNHVKELVPEKEIYFWGSLSKIGVDYSGISRDLRMHIWDTDWADPEDMYNEGFSIVNSLSSSLYIIPGGGYDRLDQEFIEKSWQPNVFETTERTWVIPAYSERMLGACYMMWNDWSHLNGESITEEDLLERFEAPLEVIAEKLWGSHRDAHEKVLF